MNSLHVEQVENLRFSFMFCTSTMLPSYSRAVFHLTACVTKIKNIKTSMNLLENHETTLPQKHCCLISEQTSSKSQKGAILPAVGLATTVRVGTTRHFSRGNCQASWLCIALVGCAAGSLRFGRAMMTRLAQSLLRLCPCKKVPQVSRYWCPIQQGANFLYPLLFMFSQSCALIFSLVIFESWHHEIFCLGLFSKQTCCSVLFMCLPQAACHWHWPRVSTMTTSSIKAMMRLIRSSSKLLQKPRIRREPHFTKFCERAEPPNMSFPLIDNNPRVSSVERARRLAAKCASPLVWRRLLLTCACGSGIADQAGGNTTFVVGSGRTCQDTPQRKRVPRHARRW